MKKMTVVFLLGLFFFGISMKVGAQVTKGIGDIAANSPSSRFGENNTQMQTFQRHDGGTTPVNVDFLKARMITLGMPCLTNPEKNVPVPSVMELFQGTVKNSKRYTILLATPSQDIQMGCVSIVYMFIETSQLPEMK